MYDHILFRALPKKCCTTAISCNTLNIKISPYYASRLELTPPQEGDCHLLLYLRLC